MILKGNPNSSQWWGWWELHSFAFFVTIETLSSVLSKRSLFLRFHSHEARISFRFSFCDKVCKVCTSDASVPLETWYFVRLSHTHLPINFFSCLRDAATEIGWLVWSSMIDEAVDVLYKFRLMLLTIECLKQNSVTNVSSAVCSSHVIDQWRQGRLCMKYDYKWHSFDIRDNCYIDTNSLTVIMVFSVIVCLFLICMCVC